jgi:tRNA(fMet)-specific endonuclease VapC
MLDTNIVSDLIRNPAGRAAMHLRTIGDHGLAVSIITAAELRFGAAKSGSPRLPNARTSASSLRPRESLSARMIF